MTDPTARPGGSPAPGWPPLSPVHRGTLRTLLTRGSRSRAEIARELDMSRASITRAARDLVDHGLVAEGHLELRGATGRPGEMLHARPEAWSFLGIKLTGDRLYAVITDLSAKILVEADEPLRSRAVEEVVAQIAEARERLEAPHPPLAAAGVALGADVRMIPGLGAMVDSSYHGWQGVPLARLVDEALGIPAHVENDVRCLTAAEHLFGVGSGLDSLVLLTVGVGLGFGMILDGRLVTGTHGKAGRLDHLPLSEDGPICPYCRRACFSAALTNDAMLRTLARPGIDYPGLVALARAGDEEALEVFRIAGRALGAATATLANTLDPQKVVVTGDGIAVTELARAEIDEAITAHAHPNGALISLEIAPFEFNEWARAAAVLAIRARIGA
ncbi:ROK family transcriptional regulator [Brachybacterium phenoliresistens]|uniref:ROK family transcriptional regulator n=1 Tax=Brachybacterium phenoliresistens TaxID=396014 RepID=Z9JWH6_9MICO|nr:ROK family transcriptional regulator [Brachybacterium phenoliresistens]EWS82373.1 ROK family transcriptional regulator [Brachybacterium phenoliresistens]